MLTMEYLKNLTARELMELYDKSLLGVFNENIENSIFGVHSKTEECSLIYTEVESRLINTMTLKDYYLLKRTKKKIRLKSIANLIGCSQSLISQYETGKCDMSRDKIRIYRDYIDNN